jgi:hypothetical protein
MSSQCNNFGGLSLLFIYRENSKNYNVVIVKCIPFSLQHCIETFFVPIVTSCADAEGVISTIRYSCPDATKTGTCQYMLITLPSKNFQVNLFNGSPAVTVVSKLYSWNSANDAGVSRFNSPVSDGPKPDSSAYVLALIGSGIIWSLYKLTLSDQTHLSLSNLV